MGNAPSEPSNGPLGRGSWRSISLHCSNLFKLQCVGQILREINALPRHPKWGYLHDSVINVATVMWSLEAHVRNKLKGKQNKQTLGNVKKKRKKQPFYNPTNTVRIWRHKTFMRGRGTKIRLRRLYFAEQRKEAKKTKKRKRMK